MAAVDTQLSPIPKGVLVQSIAECFATATSKSKTNIIRRSFKAVGAFWKNWFRRGELCSFLR